MTLVPNNKQAKPSPAAAPVMALTLCNGTRLLVILAEDDNALLRDIVQMVTRTGARAVSPRELAFSILLAMGHGPGTYPRQVAEMLVAEPTRPAESVGQEGPATPDLFLRLSAREREIAVLAARGLSNPLIAQKTGTSRFTVRNQMGRAMAKLGVRNRVELSAVVLLRTSLPA